METDPVFIEWLNTPVVIDGVPQDYTAASNWADTVFAERLAALAAGTIGFAARLLFDTATGMSVNWDARLLYGYAGDGHPTLDWGECNLMDPGDGTVLAHWSAPAGLTLYGSNPAYTAAIRPDDGTAGPGDTTIPIAWLPVDVNGFRRYVPLYA